MVNYLKIGQIINSHGIKGEMKVYPLTDDIKQFDDFKSVLFKEKSDDAYREVNVTGVKYINNFVILKLENINSIEEVKRYINQYIYINRKNAAKLSKNTYFIADIIGLSVYDVKKMNRLGKVISVMKTGKNDVYEIEKEDGSTFLIPAIDSVIKDINIEDEKMIINVIEGLL